MGSEETGKEAGKNKMLYYYLSKDSAGVKYITVSESLTDLPALDQIDSLAISCGYIKHAAPTKLTKGNKKMNDLHIKS